MIGRCVLHGVGRTPTTGIRPVQEAACGTCGLGCHVDKTHDKMAAVIERLKQPSASCSFAQLEGSE